MRLTAKKHSQPKKLLQSCRLEHNENGVLTAAIKSSEPIGGDVYGISGIYCSSPKNRAFIKKKSFADWTSKAKLILSGHCHCDRLNTSTLIPDGNGNYLRGDTSYAIAYTASASRFGGKSESTYYYPCFGKDGQIASWEYLFCQQRSSCLNDPLTGGSILFYIIQSKKVGSNPTFCYAIKDYANYESSSHSFIYAAIGDIISNDLIPSASNSILLS